MGAEGGGLRGVAVAVTKVSIVPGTTRVEMTVTMAVGLRRRWEIGRREIRVKKDFFLRDLMATDVKGLTEVGTK